VVVVLEGAVEVDCAGAADGAARAGRAEAGDGAAEAEGAVAGAGLERLTAGRCVLIPAGLDGVVITPIDAGARVLTIDPMPDGA
jgi:hypothetical protein